MTRYFSDEMQDIIEQSVGMSLKDIKEKDVDEIHGSIEKRIGKKLVLSKEPRHNSRGSVLIQLDRTITRNQLESNFNNHF